MQIADMLNIKMPKKKPARSLFCSDNILLIESSIEPCGPVRARRGPQIPIIVLCKRIWKNVMNVMTAVHSYIYSAGLSRSKRLLQTMVTSDVNVNPASTWKKSGISLRIKCQVTQCKMHNHCVSYFGLTEQTVPREDRLLLTKFSSCSLI